MNCPLCDSKLGPILAESVYWRLVLNHNQDLLGKCFLALRRHVESVLELTTDEWLDLHEQIGVATRTLRQRFDAEHFNYLFLQNQDRHVHLHIIPRYAGKRMFAEEEFDDPGYPGHYRVDGPPRRLDARTEAILNLSLSQGMDR